MNCCVEDWRPVAGFEGRYEVSNLGRVRSLTIRVRNKQALRTKHGVILKQMLNRHGYWTVNLCADAHRKHVTVSSLMGRAFLGVQPGQLTDHKDRTRANNALTNLRAATTSQNGFNAKRSSANKSGFKGVSWFKTRGKWRATIVIAGVQRHLGYFDDAATAHAAYATAAWVLAGDFAHPATQGEVLS